MRRRTRSGRRAPPGWLRFVTEATGVVPSTGAPGTVSSGRDRPGGGCAHRQVALIEPRWRQPCRRRAVLQPGERDVRCRSRAAAGLQRDQVGHGPADGGAGRDRGRRSLHLGELGACRGERAAGGREARACPARREACAPRPVLPTVPGARRPRRRGRRRPAAPRASCARRRPPPAPRRSPAEAAA